MFARKIINVGGMVKGDKKARGACMINKRFRVLTILIVVLAFFKIYQHNLLVQLTYEHQRLERHKKELEQTRNEMYISLLQRKDPDKVFAYARNKLGLQPLAINQVKVVPSGLDVIDCLHTSSTDAVLKTIGLYDLVIGKTGRGSYVRA